MLGKKTERRPAKNPTKFIGVEPGQVPDVFEAVEVFTNTEHLDKALAVMLDEIDKSEQRQNEKQKRAEDLRSEYNVFLGNVYGLFHVRRFVVDTSELVKFFDIENEHIVIPESSHKQMREQASVYTETSQGIDAYKLHKVIVENINELLGLLKNADRVRISEDLGSLFRADGEGNVTTAPVDYDFYCN